jgi:hypothetical protein
VSERLPDPDANRVRDASIEPGDLLILPTGSRVVRIHPLGGAHPAAWNEFRPWGPTRSRSDHHTRPERGHPTRRIAYVTHGPSAFEAALAEFFQDEAGRVGPFDLALRHPAISVIDLAAEVRLLDLDGGWVTGAGGNQAIRTRPPGKARDWARAIYRHHQDIEGLAYGSSVRGPGRCVALWERAEHALPAAPEATRTLDDPVLRVPIASAANELNTVIV